MSTTTIPARFYYFGVWDPKRLGHFLHKRDGYTEPEEITPWGYELDSRSHPDPEVPCTGLGIPSMRLSHKDSWTALAFWDRTGDARGKSNSVFVAHAIMTHHEMLAAAEAAFPEIWRRLHRNLETKPP